MREGIGRVGEGTANGTPPTDRPRVLFVSHDASLTGAPIVLLHLVRWLRTNANMDMEMVFVDGGPLLPEFGRYARVLRYESRPREGAARRILNRLSLPPGIDDGCKRRLGKQVRVVCGGYTGRIDPVQNDIQDKIQTRFPGEARNLVDQSGSVCSPFKPGVGPVQVIREEKVAGRAR